MPCVSTQSAYTLKGYSGGSYRGTYVVYVWTGRICWSVGVKYIYLISVFYNTVDMAYDYNSLTVFTLLYSIYSEYFEKYVRFWFVVYVSLRIEIPSEPLMDDLRSVATSSCC
jgi:hypothetical protein